MPYRRKKAHDDRPIAIKKATANGFPRKVKIIWYNPKYDRELEQSFPIKKIKEMKWANFGLFNSRCLFYEISIS